MTFFPLLLAALAALPQDPADSNPVELGSVAWGRELPAALAESGRTGKPVFLLFQEIPGCHTCVDFGQGPLSHPLLVAAIETEFVPVAIHNNKEGRDAEVLARYEESAWNNPVVRFVDAEGEDVLPRKDEVWSTPAVAARMVAALRASGRKAPPYLELARLETDTAHHQAATFAMHCFWEGEARLGSLAGVVRTRAGWVDSKEVVEVVFDPRVTSYSALLERATAMECASTVFTTSPEQEAAAGARGEALEAAAADAKESDRLYYLRRSVYRFVPLTNAQAVKVNAALGLGRDARRWLTGDQQALVGLIESLPEDTEEVLVELEPLRSAQQLRSYREELGEYAERVSAEG